MERKLAVRGAAVWACACLVVQISATTAAAQQIFAPEDVEATAAEPVESYPRLEGEISIEVQNDLTYDADDKDAELNDLFNKTEAGFAFRFSRELSIQTGLVLEPVRDPEPGEDRFFEDEGLYVETLGLYYETGAFSIYGGKFNPPFGTAWDIAPGIYGTDFAEDYELTERVGGGASLTFGEGGIGGAGFGTHTLSANAFFADTSFLSQSALTKRGDTDEEDGGPSNTEDLSSFTLTLDGGALPGLPGLGYHLGVSHQAAGVGDADDEEGYVAGLNGDFALSDTLTLAPLLEYAHFDSAEGAAQDRDYLTVAAALIRGPWNVAASYTQRRTEPEAGDSVDDDLFQLSAGYAFENGLTADVGYRYAEEDGLEAHTFGLLFTYAFDFAVD